ncbi:MAG: DUF3997 domain-containing protein, partial [Bacilli bacterium]|nr:DUF3997 domain-containing protein [Bacilli bacterium]
TIPIKEDTWSYKLISKYSVEKIDEDNIIITKKGNKKPIISEYVEAYAISDKYICARVLVYDKNLDVLYYIIDSKKDDVIGPYDINEFSNKLKELKIEDINWIETLSL